MRTVNRPRQSTDHRLPHPKRPLDPFRDPFVGNSSVGDNLHEMIQTALWAKLGGKAAGLSVDISETTATLGGTLDTEPERLAAVAAAKAVRGVRSVVDHIEVRSQEGPRMAGAVGPARLIWLRRFCSMDEASTSAAIRQAVAQLDRLFSEEAALPQSLVIVYSNVLARTVTLDIGMPFEALPVLPHGSEFRIAPAPREADAELLAAAGFDGLVAACHALAPLDDSHRHPNLAFWQKFEARDFRPWTGHPEATLHLVH